MQSLRCHSLSVITDCKNNCVLFFPAGYRNLTFTTAIFYSMIKGIFCQRLNRKFRNLYYIHFFWYGQFKFQNIMITELLNFQITQRVSFFFRKRNDVISLRK